jgi:hypothetical protein
LQQFPCGGRPNTSQIALQAPVAGDLRALAAATVCNVKHRNAAHLALFSD